MYMVRKKIQKSGNSRFVYLPIDWVKKLEGNEINLEVNERGNVVISPTRKGEETKLRKEVTLEKRDIDFIVRVVAALYVGGYDECEINFEKNLGKNVQNELRETISKRLDVEIAELNESSMLIKISPGFLEADDLAQIIVKKVLNEIRAITEEDMESAERLQKEHVKSVLTFQRLVNSVLQKPYLLEDMERKPIELLNILFILYSAKEIGNYVIESEVDSSDLETLIEIFELSWKMIQESSFDSVSRINSLRKEIEKDPIEIWVRVIERKFHNLTALS